MASSKDLICTVDKDFYKEVYSSRQMASFLRDLISAICEENSLSAPKLKFQKIMPFICGDYRHKKGLIILNSFLYQNFDYFKETNNLYYVFKFLESVLHETRHHIQFFSSENKDLHPLIKNITNIAKYSSGLRLVYSGNYFAVPIEVDARHYSYQRISENRLLSRYLDSQSYIDNEINNSECPFEYELLLKNVRSQYKFAQNAIKKALSTIDDKDCLDRNKAVYYTIAPNFKLNENSPLSKEENQILDQERIEFESVCWKNLLEYVHQTNKMNYTQSEIICDK